MIKSVSFKKDYLCFKEGESYSFKPGLNILCGDQGSGKSSLMRLLTSHDLGKRGLVRLEVDEKTKTSFFDFEKMNPRSQSRVETMFDAQCLFSSHGQVNNRIIRSLPKIEGSTVFLDEPDSALSIRSCYDLLRILNEAVEFGMQVLASIHNPTVIANVGEVLSLEHKCWMTSTEFISSQSKPRQVVDATIFQQKCS